ncbi:MAG: peptidylprolyl isomerase [Myxococcales bacterium]|nr:peptidylprolyl isomerase [Myxococcales bacterium]
MKIAADTVATIDYTVRNDRGDILDSSKGQPMTYLHGHQQIIRGLESALEGLSAGERCSAAVSPSDAYGERDDEKVLSIQRDRLPADLEPEVGMMLGAQDEDGETVPLWIVEVGKDMITVDTNHPLAGQVLNFEVTVHEVRSATEEELAHGHAHGSHGHHHH